jgi:hypothetical protein
VQTPTLELAAPRRLSRDELVLWRLEESGLSVDELLGLAWDLFGDPHADWLPLAV